MSWDENQGQVASPLTQWPWRPVVCWRTRFSLCLLGRSVWPMGQLKKNHLLVCRLWPASRLEGTSGQLVIQTPWGAKPAFSFLAFQLLQCLEAKPEGGRWMGGCGGEISTWVRRASLTSLGTHLIALGERNSQVKFLLHIRPSSWRQALPGAEGVTLGGGRKQSSCQILDVFVQSVC